MSKRFGRCAITVMLLFALAQAQQPTSSVTGRVTDMLGLPLEGVDVSFQGRRGAMTGPVKTGAGGLYTLTCAEQQYGTLRVSADGLRVLEEEAFCSPEVDASRRDVTLVLGQLGGAGGNVTGVVTDATGHPLHDATVWLNGIGTSQLRQDARSMKNGSYSIDVGLGGDYVLCARHAKARPECRAVRVQLAEQAVTVRVDLTIHR